MLREAESLDHGVGVFATQSVPVGTLLWREKPLVMLDMKEVAVETDRMMAARHKGEDGLATATRVPSTNPSQSQTIFPPQVVQLCQVINSFMTLTKEEKLSYLQLKDVFDYLNKPNDFPIDVNTIDVAIFKEIICTSREAAARVWGIFNTNQLQGRLALGVSFVLFNVTSLMYSVQVSRVNHSCSPKCELVWNGEHSSLDIR